MGFIKQLLTILILCFIACNLNAQTNIHISGKVRDGQDKSPLPGATVSFTGSNTITVITDENGTFSVKVPSGSYSASVSFVGYKQYKRELNVKSDTHLNIDLASDLQLNEVVVTAKQGQGPVTSSVIGRDAMQHLQPNSIADLMELLPGGYSKDPDMGSANTITLRETGTMDAYGNSTKNNAYSISSLGTQFLVDGVPISTDANLQYSPVSSTQSSSTGSTAEDYRNITNKGVDMRTISTDDIESVEVIRGIPSVEYGNLTSGIVSIKKIRKVMPLTARFKADGYSKLFSVGKGFALNASGMSILNVDLGYLDSKIDPTDNLENYKRLTASLRFTNDGGHDDYEYRFSSAFDYSGSFDDSKTDPDLNYGNIEEYKSEYSRMALTNNMSMRWNNSFFKQLDINTMLSLQLDRLEQTRLVSPQRYGIVPTNMEEGEYEAQAVFSEYQASYLCDGKPFNAYIKIKGIMGFRLWQTTHSIKTGLNWEFSKNYGKGQVYDMNAPLSVSSWSSRPRKYSDIPSLQNLSYFIEDMLTAPIGKSRLELMAGVRLNTMPGLSSKYTMSGRIYADPRLNANWQMPTIDLGGDPLTISLNGGWGITTKMPTLNYLYPDKYYSNFISLAYYDTQNPTQDSKFVVTTYIQDPTNYDIKPARNTKWEVRLDMRWRDNTLSVDYFHESMTSGFRYSTVYDTYTYKKYDESAMSAGVDYLTLPYETKTVLDGYQKVTNGSKLVKQGIELTFNSQRIKCLRTRVNVTGAWFRSVYTNSQPMFESVSAVIDNEAVSDKYVGLYAWNNGRQNDQLNTNITFDTQIPEWKFIFTTSVQCMWLIRTKSFWKDGTPMAYLSAEDGQLHEFTESDLDNIYLQQLVKTYNESQFTPFTVPMSMVINFKATKEIGKYMRLAFFANKILDYMPDYTANGSVIRRNASPYFGVEANFTI